MRSGDMWCWVRVGAAALCLCGAQPAAGQAGGPEEDATQVMLSPQDQAAALTDGLIALTAGLYAEALTHQGDCGAMTDAVTAYLDREEAALVEVVDGLQAAVARGDLSAEALASAMQAALDDTSGLKAGQSAIYACARGKEAQGRKRALSKLLQRFYALHEPLLREVAGPLE
jgi:hypothetical protein